MGLDTIHVECPSCNKDVGFYSFTGPCTFGNFYLNSCSNNLRADVAIGVNKKSGRCSCGTVIKIEMDYQDVAMLVTYESGMSIQAPQFTTAMSYLRELDLPKDVILSLVKEKL